MGNLSNEEIAEQTVDLLKFIESQASAIRKLSDEVRANIIQYHKATCPHQEKDCEDSFVRLTTAAISLAVKGAERGR